MIRPATSALVLVATLLALPAPARARGTLEDYDRITVLVRQAAAASTPVEIDRMLRAVLVESGTANLGDGARAFAAFWYDDWAPRARVWIRGVSAEHLFRDILLDNYLLEAIDLEGTVDVELEIRAGNPALIRGRILLRDALFRWKTDDLALAGVSGALPFRRTIGSTTIASPLTPSTLRIDTMLWAGRPVATRVSSAAAIDNRILKFDRLQLTVMGGSGLGSVVMDHRGERWRSAAMIRLSQVDLRRIDELLPSLPIVARVTRATMEGEIGMIYEAPNRLAATGRLVSTAPGIIEIAPRLRETLRAFIDTRVIRFSKLEIDLGYDEKQQPEAVITLTRQTSANLADLWRGQPFIPHRLVVRVPVLPFVQQLSER